MNSSTPDLHLIVGRNVSGAETAAHFAKELKTQLLWLQTEKDRQQSKDNGIEDSWVIAALEESMPWQKDLILQNHAYELFDIPFFFARQKRVSVSDFETRSIPFLKEIHPAILNRILAVSHWNDFSPYLWSKDFNGNYSPNSQWIFEAPKSRRLRDKKRLALFHRNSFIECCRKFCEELGAKTELKEKAALGVQLMGKEGHRIIFNAPFEPLLVHKILWMSRGSSLQEEHRTLKVSRKNPNILSSPSSRSIARWESFSAEVPLNFLASISLFSIWIDHEDRGRGLLKSGRLSSHSIKRVIVLPQHSAAKGLAKLIIQELIVDESFDESFPVEKNQRKDFFLWKECPALKTLDLVFQQIPTIDEEIFYLDPLSSAEEMAANCWILPSKPTFTIDLEIEKFMAVRSKEKT